MTEAESLIPYLYSFDAREAAVRLAQLGEAAVAPLIAVLSGQDAPDLSGMSAPGMAVPAGAETLAARERAAYILGEIGNPGAVEALITAYRRENDRYIRLAAARALGKIGDPRGIDTLIDALAGRAWTPDYCFLVDDLARTGGERAVVPLAGVLQSEHYSYGSGARAALHLVTYRDDPRVLEGLIGGLKVDAEIATVRAVIAVLAQIGGEQVNRALLAFVGRLAALPPERWDDRDDNLSETGEGMVFHILKTELGDAARAIRQSGDAEISVALDNLLAGIPA